MCFRTLAIEKIVLKNVEVKFSMWGVRGGQKVPKWIFVTFSGQFEKKLDVLAKNNLRIRNQRPQISL